MKSRLFLFFATLFLAVGMNAQVKNIGAGAAFFGDLRIAVQGAEDHGNLYVNSYRPVLGGTAFYEVSSGSASHMFEVDYLTGALVNVKESEKYYIEGWDPANFQSAKFITGFYYIGINNRSAQRFQLPFYFGLGLSYNDADPIKCMGFVVGAKLRARFYITDRIGIWGGGSVKYGYGETQVTADMSKSVIQRVLALEAGLTISL